MSPSLPTGPGKSKGFFDNPEKTIAFALPVIAGAVVVYIFGSEIGDFVVHAADNALHLTVCAVALAAILMLVFDPKLRMLMFYLYRALIHMGWGLLVDNDPISVLKTYLDRMKEKLSEFDSGLDKLCGQRTKMNRQWALNKDKMQAEYSLVKTAKKQAENETLSEEARNAGRRALVLESRQVERLEHNDVQLAEQIKQFDTLIVVMKRYREICSDAVVDMGREVEYRKEQIEFTKASRSVLGGAKAILKGLPEQEFYQDANAVIDTRYTDTMGEIEGFLNSTSGILSTADLSDTAHVQMLLDRINATENANAQKVIGGKDSTTTKAEIFTEARKQVESGSPTA